MYDAASSLFGPFAFFFLECVCHYESFVDLSETAEDRLVRQLKQE
jgi:hypothetical protein